MSTPDLSDIRWRKSSYSNGGNNGACVEVAFLAPAVAVRDAKNVAGPVLAVTGSAWRGLLRTAVQR